MTTRFASYKPYPEIVAEEGNKIVIHVKLDIGTEAFRINAGTP